VIWHDAGGPSVPPGVRHHTFNSVPLHDEQLLHVRRICFRSGQVNLDSCAGLGKSLRIYCRSSLLRQRPDRLAEKFSQSGTPHSGFLASKCHLIHGIRRCVGCASALPEHRFSRRHLQRSISVLEISNFQIREPRRPSRTFPLPESPSIVLTAWRISHATGDQSRHDKC